MKTSTRRDTTGFRTAGQGALLSASRHTEKEDWGATISSASIDDLEWFLQMLDLTLEETPHWVSDEAVLHRSQAWTRRVRTVVVEVLHNKRVKARPRALLLKAAWALCLVIIGAVLGVVLTKHFG